MSQSNRGPANRNRTRPVNRTTPGRGSDQITSARSGWAQPATAVRTKWRTGPLPVPVVGLAAGLWAAIVGLVITVVLTLIVWIFAAGDSASDTAMRVGANVWLAAHGTPFRIGAGVWSLMPWAWLVFPGLTLWAAGRWVAHRAAIAFAKSAAVAAGTLAAGYSLIALFASLFGTLSGAGAMPMRAVVHSFVIAFLISGAAILWRARLGKDVASAAWQMVRPAVGALATLIAGAAAVFVVALIASFSAISANLAEVAPGLIGGIALLIGWLGYLPTVLFWGLSYATGAGIMVGGAAVTPLAPLPGPIEMLGLAMIPTTPHPWLLVGVLIPVTAGVVLNRIAGSASSRRYWLQSRAIALAAVLIAIDLWWYISVGRIGEGRLDLLGPPPLVIPILMVGLVVGIAGDLGLTRAWRWWRGRRAGDPIEPVVEEAAPDSEDVSATS